MGCPKEWTSAVGCARRMLCRPSFCAGFPGGGRGVRHDGHLCDGHGGGEHAGLRASPPIIRSVHPTLVDTVDVVRLGRGLPHQRPARRAAVAGHGRVDLSAATRNTPATVGWTRRLDVPWDRFVVVRVGGAASSGLAGLLPWARDRGARDLGSGPQPPVVEGLPCVFAPDDLRSGRVWPVGSHRRVALGMEPLGALEGAVASA